MTAFPPNSSTIGDVASFYDETLKKRLEDFVVGNERISRGIGLVKSVIDPSAVNVLEIGCGLGIVALELAQAYKRLRIHAVDISPKTIAAAQRLFGEYDRITFEVSEMAEVPRFAPYDVILLLDVYEHIPRDIRPRLHEILGQSLSPTGAVVLTLPSPLHQRHLARENPSGLQIVDEVVELEDLVALSREISAQIVYFFYVSIWNSNDYMHVVIRREPSYQPLTWQRLAGLFDRIKARASILRERAGQRSRSARRRRLVQDRLGISPGTTT